DDPPWTRVIGITIITPATFRGESMSQFQEIFRRTVCRWLNPRKPLALLPLTVLLVVSWFELPPQLNLNAGPQASPQAVTDAITYNVGDQVRVRIVFPSSQTEHAQTRYVFAVRYAGETKPVADGLVPGDAVGASGYRLFWKVPADARAGRYEIDLRVQDPKSRQTIQNVPSAGSFVVHRQAIRVTVEVRGPYFTSGD